MSIYNNNVVIKGNLGKPADIVETKAGTVAKFSLAVYRSGKGEDSVTDWLNVVAWHDLARGMAQLDKGTKQFNTIAKGTYQFMDSDSKTVISGTWFGSGSDTSDKGLYKAITGGIKYVLNTNFLIPTGDDPENDGSKPEVDLDTQLKKDLIKKHKGDKVKAKAEYMTIKAKEIAKPKEEAKEDAELESDIEEYLEEKFEMEGAK